MLRWVTSVGLYDTIEEFNVGSKAYNRLTSSVSIADGHFEWMTDGYVLPHANSVYTILNCWKLSPISKCERFIDSIDCTSVSIYIVHNNW